MKHRFFSFLLILVPVAIIVIFLLRDRSPFGGRNSSFAVDRGKEITKIEFTSGTSGISLEKNDGTWLVDGRLEARKTSIQFILRILTGLEIKSPVSPELFRAEITDKDVTPVKVKVFQGRRIAKSFFVFKTSSNRYGNIMKLRTGSKPFIVYVPGNEAEIGSAFNTNELFWEPFTVFELLPSEIADVTVENIKDPESSFMIRHKNGKFILSDTNTDLIGWDTSKVIRYLSYFTHVQFESWALDLPPEEKQKILLQQPVYRISVGNMKGVRTILNLWEKRITENGNEKTDSDRLWAKTDSGNEIFVIRYIDIDPILKKRSYFFPE